MFPIIGSLLVAAAGHLLGKAAGKVWDTQAKRETAPAAGASSGSFASALSNETQRHAQAPGLTATGASRGPGLPPASGDFGGLRDAAAARIEAP
jgi:hypothetical protein